MGIPVSGKNLFPSNIQGLPTWYEMRVNKDGHTARALDYDLMVAMNAETYARDVKEVRSRRLSALRLDLAARRRAAARRTSRSWACRSRRCATRPSTSSRERILMKNIAYAGRAGRAARHRHGRSSTRMLEEKYSQEEGAARLEPQGAARSATTTRSSTSTARCRFRLEKMDATSDNILIDGNTATALGCVYAGATVAAWYPITPSTSVMDAFKEFCQRVPAGPGDRQEQLLHPPGRGRAGGHRHGHRRQLERRARVHVDVGPGHLADERAHRPGLLRRDPGGDLRRAAHGAVDRHADAHAAGRHPGVRLRLARRHQAHPAVPGAAPTSASTSRWQSFDLAERFQTPVFMLSRSRHRHERLGLPAPELGRRLPPEPRAGAQRGELEAMPKFFRYSPEDGDHVAARTLPGVHPKGAFFTRGSGHNKLGGYTEIPDEYQEVMDRLARKHKAAAKAVPAPIIRKQAGRHVRHRHRRRLRSGGARGDRDARRRAASSPTTCACAASRSTTTSRRSWRRTSASSSSSRTATRSCARC